ncbi:mucin-binding protein [Fructilactobacillus frigidiflavus]|uniref:mucin-binding protein n=1 Tax=Fructilactobacillus frigidiflavus TaxID=3242688 RepID=UPI003757F5BD
MKNNNETKLHYKMYKSGKIWLFASITVTFFGITGVQVTTHASDTNPDAAVVAKTDNQASTNNSQPSAESPTNPSDQKTTDVKQVDVSSNPENQVATSSTETKPAIENTNSAPITDNQENKPDTNHNSADAKTDVKDSQPAPDSAAKPVENTDQPVEVPKTDENSKLNQANTALAATNNVTQGTWGTANWNYDNDSKVVTVQGNQNTTFGTINEPRFPDAVTKIVIDGKVKANQDSSFAFANYSDLTEIDGINNIDTSDVTNMQSMFAEDYKLAKLDGLQDWDVSNVTNLSSFFLNDRSLTKVNVGWKDTSKFTDINTAFSNILSPMDYTKGINNQIGNNDHNGLREIDGLNTWDVSHVTNMNNLFYNDYVLSSLDLSNWNTASLTSCNNMFQSNYYLTNLNLTGWNTKNVTDMSYMFCGLGTYTAYYGTLPVITGLNSFDTSNVTNMSYMFHSYTGNYLDLSSFDTSNVTTMERMLDTSSLLTLDLSNFDTTKVTNMNNMFNSDDNLVSLNISGFDTRPNQYRSSVSMTGMLSGVIYTDSKPSDTWGLTKLILGDNTLLNADSGLLNPPKGEIVPTTTSILTSGTWQNLGTGYANVNNFNTPSNNNYKPNGQFITASDLTNGQAHPGTWVWSIDQSSLTAHDVTIHLGETLPAASAFGSATDAYGNPETLTVDTQNVNNQLSGDYPATVSANGVTKDVTVHVLNANGDVLAGDLIKSDVANNAILGDLDNEATQAQLNNNYVPNPDPKYYDANWFSKNQFAPDQNSMMYYAQINPDGKESDLTDGQLTITPANDDPNDDSNGSYINPDMIWISNGSVDGQNMTYSKLAQSGWKYVVNADGSITLDFDYKNNQNYVIAFKVGQNDFNLQADAHISATGKYVDNTGQTITKQQAQPDPSNSSKYLNQNYINVWGSFPTVSVSGDDVTYYVGDNPADLQYHAQLNYADGTTSDHVKVDTSKVDFSTPGIYTATIIDTEPGYAWVTNTLTVQVIKKVEQTKAITRTINYVDEKGNPVDKATVQVVTFTETGEQTSTNPDVVKWNDDWTSDGNFGAVQSPELSNRHLVDESQATISAETPSVNDTNQIINVKYADDTQKVSENKDVTRTINYVDDQDQTIAPAVNQKVTFSRTGTKDLYTGNTAWQTWTSTGDFGAVQSPELKNRHLVDASQATISAETPSVNDTNQIINVKYADDTQTVSENKEVTRTINYVDDQGQTFAPAVNQKVMFSRTGTKDLYTGNTDWQAWTSTGDFSAVQSPELSNRHLVDASQATISAETPSVNDTNQIINVKYADDTQTVSENKEVTRTINYVDDQGQTFAPAVNQKVMFSRTGTKDLYTGNTDWQAWTSTGDFSAVQSPELSNRHLVDASQATISAETPSVNDTNQIINVKYADDTQTVSENKEVTRTINYVDDQGQTVAPAVNQKVMFSRTGTKDLYTGNTDWQNWTSTGDFGAVQSPELSNRHLVDASQATIPAENPSVNDTDQTINVRYADDTQKVSENKDVTRTINYVDDQDQTIAPAVNQKVTFSRTGTKDLLTGKTDWQSWTSTGDFGAVQSPELKNRHLVDESQATIVAETPSVNDADQTINVRYADDTQTVSENKDVTRTINYVDDQGQAIAPAVDQKVTFSREGTKDLYTGKTDWQNWTSDGNFGAVQSPELSNRHLVDASQATIAAETPSVNDADQTINVRYADDTQTVSENKDVTRTINYVDEQGQTIDPAVNQKVTFSREGTKDLYTGKTDWQNWTSDGNFGAVQLPELSNRHLVDASQATIAAETPIVNDADQTINVRYADDTQTVSENKDVTRTINYVDDQGQAIAPAVNQKVTFNREGTKDLLTGKTDWQTWTSDGNFGAVQSPELKNRHLVDESQATIPAENPSVNDTDQTINVRYADDTQKVSENKDVTRTINYVDDQDQTIAPAVNQKVTFSREGTKDLLTGKTDWQNWTSTGDFGAVQSPELKNRHLVDASQATIAAEMPSVNDADQTINVKYADDTQVVSENKEVTRTINYVDDQGQAIAPAVDQVTFSREGTKDLVTGKTEWQTWTSTGKFGAVQSPELSNRHLVDASQATITAETPSVNDANQIINVRYVDDTQTVSENKDVTRTINYVDEQGQTIAPAVDQKVTFSREGTKDLVTGKTDWQTWTSTGKFGAVQSPELSNRHLVDASQATITAETPSVNDANQIINVRYVDDTQTVSENKDVTRTINYVDEQGQTIAPAVDQKVTFSREGTKDLVTGKTDWQAWTSNGNFGAVQSPELNNRHLVDASQATIAAKTPSVNDANQIINVRYTDESENNIPNDSPKDDINKNYASNKQSDDDLNPTTSDYNKPDEVDENPSMVKQHSDNLNQPEKVSNKQNELPDTGASNESLIEIIGGFLILITTLFGIRGLKKRK